MKRERIALVVVLVLVVAAIAYLESSRVRPPTNVSSENVVHPDIVNPSKEGVYQKASELVGISGYLNTNGSAINLSDFEGKVVLVDFWTYTCINCIRTFPFLIDWDAKYRDKGLVIVGVHTPEFEFEKEYDNVQMAIDKYGIEYSVVQDNDYATWRAYKNRYWPHKYLIDSEGYIRYDHIGEGAYEETEKKIQELLAEIGEDVSEMGVSEIEEETPTHVLTPELYAGYTYAIPRGQYIGNPEGLKFDATHNYVLPAVLRDDILYLDGEWVSTSEYLRAQDAATSSLVLSFLAEDVNIVADAVDGPVELDVFVDGVYVSEEQAGDDVIVTEDQSYVIVDEPRLYNLIAGEYGRYTLTLRTNATTFTFNAFTFG